MRLLPPIAALALLLAPSGPVRAENTTVLMPVPVVTIRQGEVITEGALSDRRMVASAKALRTYVLSGSNIVGKVARRTLPAGAAIALSAIREPTLFSDGQRVTISFGRGQLTIEGSGVALQAGAEGDSVNVRNVDSGIIVRGVVQADGRVLVGGGR